MPTVYPYIEGLTAKTRFENSSGLALSGGKVYFYEAGTSTPKNTYSDSAGSSANANPVILDSRGEADIYLLGDAAYKITVTDSSDVQIYTRDNVWAQVSLGQLSSLIRSLIDDSDEVTALDTLKTRRRNLLANGDFNIWHRNTTWTGITATTQRTANMTRFRCAGASVWRVDRSTEVPTVAQARRKMNYSWRLRCTTADASIAATDLAVMEIPVLGFDYAKIYQQKQCLAFWIRSDKTGTYVATVRNGTDRSYVQTFTISTANTWEEKTIQISTAPTDGGTWNFTTGAGVYVTIAFMAGTNFHGTSGQWNTSDVYGVTGMVNAASDTNTDIYITDVRLAPGLDATYLDEWTEAEQETYCQRLFCKSYNRATFAGAATDTQLSSFQAINANEAIGQGSDFPVRMISAPTVTIYDIAGTVGQATIAESGANVASVTVDRVTERGIGRLQSTGGWADNNTLVCAWVADAEL